MSLIEILEIALDKKAEKKMRPIQPGDILATYADVVDLEREINFRLQTSIQDGVLRFVEWHLGKGQELRGQKL